MAKQYTIYQRFFGVEPDALSPITQIGCACDEKSGGRVVLRTLSHFPAHTPESNGRVRPQKRQRLSAVDSDSRSRGLISSLEMRETANPVVRRGVPRILRCEARSSPKRFLKAESVLHFYLRSLIITSVRLSKPARSTSGQTSLFNMWSKMPIIQPQSSFFNKEGRMGEL